MKREDFIEMETLISDLQLNFEYSFSESRPSVIKYSGIQTIESEGSLDNMGEEESGRDELMIHGNNDIAEFPHCYCGNIAVQKKDLIQAESSLSVEKLEKCNFFQWSDVNRQKISGSIRVSARQRGNPVLKHIRKVPWEFAEGMVRDNFC